MFKEISYSLAPCVNEFTLQLPDFSKESVESLVKLSNLNWTEHQAWNVEDLELFQHLGILVRVKLRESPDIVIDEIIEDDPEEPVLQVQRKLKPKCKSLRTANLVKPASNQNNNSRKRKGKSVDGKVVSPRNTNMKQTCDGGITIKKCKVMLKNEKFTNICPSSYASIVSMDNVIEGEKTDETKNIPNTPVVMVENPLYDIRMETNKDRVLESLTNTGTDSFEGEKEDNVIEEIVTLIKTNDIKNNEQENCIKRESIFKTEENDEEKEEQTKEVDSEGDSPDEEEEYHQIQRTLIQEQDLSDDEGSDDEDHLDYTALHNTRDTILKELGLSDDESS